MSEHDVDCLTLKDLRAIPGIGSVCIDMVIQARSGAKVTSVIDLKHTTEEELEASIFGSNPKPIKPIGDPNEMVDPDTYMEEDEKFGNVPVVKALGAVNSKFWYDEKTEELVMRVPIPARHVDWVQRLSDYAKEINEKNVHHLYEPEQLVRKFILEARLQDKSDAGRRVNSTTTQTAPPRN